MTRSTVALFGYGRFGQAFATLLRQAGHAVRVVDPVASVPAELAAASPEQALAAAHWVVLAMPLRRMRAALLELRPLLHAQHRVIDVGSVKLQPQAWMDELLGPAIAHIGSHPLFGPLSLARGERPLRVVLCASAQHPQLPAAARALFEQIGCQVIDRDAAAHDEAMAQTHALAFYIAKALVEMGIGDDLSMAPPSFLGLSNMLAAVRGDAGHLFAAIQQENPYAAAARERFIATLGTIHERLQRESDAGALAIPSPGQAGA